MTAENRGALRLFSWNVNGLRAAYRKGFMDWLAAERPDILCLQEVRALPEQLPKDLQEPQGYQAHWAPAERKGYSGVALLTRREPSKVILGLGDEIFDREGRTIQADYGDFVLLTAYFPNGSRDHSRVPFKMAYKRALLERAEALRSQGRAVIICGDVNTAHREIDLARPAQNQNTTGFLPQERAWIDEVLERGYLDAFRELNPDREGAYSWWANWGGARERNIGWRIDYFFITPDMRPRLLEAGIHADVMGSDHCPVSLTLG